jgi:hypothetical protein
MSFCWGLYQQILLAELKIAFLTVPVQIHFDYEKEIVLETDTSSYISTAILSQYNDSGVLYPDVFFSKKTFTFLSSLQDLQLTIWCDGQNP